MRPASILPRVTFAFANIPHDRTILQFLVNDFCSRWNQELSNETDTQALMAFPPAFSAQVARRYAYCNRGKTYDGCYVEHTIEEEQQACKKTHMEFVGGGTDYGFFGEPRPK